MTKNRKMYNKLKESGFKDDDILSFCEKYLELLLESYTKPGINESDLADKVLKDKLVYKDKKGQWYVE